MAKKKQEVQTEVATIATSDEVLRDLAKVNVTDIPDIPRWNARAIVACETANKIVVKSDEDAGKAVDVTKNIKTMFNEVEASRKELVSPFNEYVKKINTAYKSITETLSEAEGIIKDKLLDWSNEKDRIRLEEQRRRDEDYRKQLELQRKEQEAFGSSEAVHVPLPVIQKPIEGESAGLQTRMVWGWDIEDIGEVPRPFLLLNDRAVRESVMQQKDAGIEPTINGLKIYQRKAVAVR
jgi:hypothetical protein